LGASHVEHQAAIILRKLIQAGQSVSGAKLLLNKAPCPPPVQGCAANLGRMLPPGVSLEIWVGSRTNKPTSAWGPTITGSNDT
jgi:hypothetical protein